MLDYREKDESYFRAVRRDIAPLLPARARRVLELGCGAGATLDWLKRSGRAGETVGIELVAAAAEQARRVVDTVHCLDIERAALPELGRFDLILCLDVLEHLRDPWALVDRLVRDHLEPGGTIVVSVPNVRHYSVVLPLLLRGRWQYADQGTLDRTHLRFFTLASALQLLRHPLLGAPRCARPGFEPGSAKFLFNAATLGLLREFLAYHYLVAAVRLDAA